VASVVPTLGSFDVLALPRLPVCQKTRVQAAVMRDPGAGEERIPVDPFLGDDRGFGTIYMVSPGITRIPSPLSFSWVLCKTYCMMASSTGNLPACHLLGVTVASALYSVYVLAFGASIHFLFNVRGRRVRPNKIILAVSVIIFLCISVARPASPLQVHRSLFSQQWCIYIVYIYTAFVVHGDTANGALAFFSGISMLQVAQIYLFSVTGALLDIVLVRISSYKCERLLRAPQVYRMYIVWGRYWPLVVLPCACIAAYMTSAVVRYYI
jgi:hypothetical protein